MRRSRHYCQSVRIALSALLCLSTSYSLTCQPVGAQSFLQEDEYANGYKPITNDQFLGIGTNTPQVYLFRAEIAIRNRQWNQAVAYLRESLSGDDDDIDTHKYLALCLEEKMKLQPEHDPETYKECVKEWLIVLRNTKGPEKGLTFKNGISPTNNKKWEDEMGAMMARQHLIKITGSEPKRWETNNKYLVRVAKPAEEIVSAKMLSKKPAAKKEGVDQ